MHLESKGPADLARYCAQILHENKLEDIRIFDVAAALGIADLFVVASARNSRHVKAARDDLLKKLREAGIQRRGLEGDRESRWILVDFSDVVVHIFVEETRRHYDLESLWGDCPRLEWSAECHPTSVASSR